MYNVLLFGLRVHPSYFENGHFFQTQERHTIRTVSCNRYEIIVPCVFDIITTKDDKKTKTKQDYD